MNKLFSIMVASSLVLACGLPSFAVTKKTTSSDSKMTKLKNGALWAPRKVGAGMKAMGDKTKKMLHHK